LFTIFTTAYIIILAFIETVFKFIGIMATIPIKGLLGMLGLFYNNSKSIKKGEESKQLIEPRSSPELRYIIPTLTPVMLGINNP